MTAEAEVIFSLAMIPHVRTINGHQAVCRHHHDDGSTVFIGDDLVDGVWLGEWRERWFDARLDALFHSLAAHGTSPHIPQTNWLDLLKGPPVERSTLHQHPARDDPDDPRRTGHRHGSS